MAEVTVKDIVHRVQASESEREVLLDKLRQSAFDPTALERQVHYARDLNIQTLKQKQQAQDAKNAVETARKEQDHQSSVLKLLGNKIHHKSAQGKNPKELAENACSESIQRSHEVERELQNLNQMQQEANKELQTLTDAGSTCNSLLTKLEAIYEIIFAGYGPDKDLQQPLEAAQADNVQIGQRIQTEDRVIDNLRKADAKYKSVRDPFAEMLASSQWQGWSMGSGASGTFANEDKNMGKILAIVEQADACVDAAREDQAKVDVTPINIDTEGTQQNSLFRKMVLDPAYLTKMEAYVTQIRRSEGSLHTEIEKSSTRKQQARADKTTAEKNVTIARQRLVDKREALIRKLNQQ